MSAPPTAAPLHTANPSRRLIAIDALRGLVILFMLLDHVRETFFLHRQVGDPMDVVTTEPALFFSRTLAHLCAPVFIFLTGLSAYLYGEKHSGRGAVATFLFKRGLFLVLLELTVINFAWTFQFPPTVIYLQVIWAIGISMLALSALVWLPRGALLALGAVIVAGHNLLDPLHFPEGHALHGLWAVLHDRGWLVWDESLRLRTSYPVLPWIGVIALGYAAGPWFGSAANCAQRMTRLATAVGVLAALFTALRWVNGYGEKPWQQGADGLQTLMSLLNITKYPPSLLFLCLTLALGLALLMLLERQQGRRAVQWLALLGGAPMFFYIVHLYVLKLLYLAALAVFGQNHGAYFGFDHMYQVWLATAVLGIALYPAAAWFARLKARRRDIAWLKYL